MTTLSELDNLHLDIEVASPEEYVDGSMPMLVPEGMYDLVITEWDVSRCLKDPEARELRLYWDAAIDLNRVMTWKGPVSTGRKT